MLVAALAATAGLLHAGWAAGSATGTVVFVAAIALGALEVLAPHSTEWRLERKSFAVDLTHTLATAYVVAPAVRATLAVSLAAIGSRLLHGPGAAAPWPTSWPVALQVALAVVLADFGAYSAHRFMHATRIGWRLHAVHHSPQRLNFLASARSHPFNVILTFSVENGPLILLGVTPEVLAYWTVIKAVNGLLQHSNIAFVDGPVSRVLATAEVHRWHHSVVLDESNRNFGNTTMLWDQLLGTYFRPLDRHPGTTVGVSGALIPERYLAHLVTPFALDRFERDAEAAAVH
ncbi:MAG: sterol desaturase family protein [Deltaproteobacteria bacterium]|nr:sterol desaturase family protein [Deltaproteobacteria bacterium]